MLQQSETSNFQASSSLDISELCVQVYFSFFLNFWSENSEQRSKINLSNMVLKL